MPTQQRIRKSPSSGTETEPSSSPSVKTPSTSSPNTEESRSLLDETDELLDEIDEVLSVDLEEVEEVKLPKARNAQDLIFRGSKVSEQAFNAFLDEQGRSCALQAAHNQAKEEGWL